MTGTVDGEGPVVLVDRAGWELGDDEAVDKEMHRYHAPGTCSVWLWCCWERDDPREDDPNLEVRTHRRRVGVVRTGDGHEIVVGIRAADRDAPAVMLVGCRPGPDGVEILEPGEAVEGWAALTAVEVQAVVEALARAVELIAEQSVATPTLRALRKAAGTSRAAR